MRSVPTCQVHMMCARRRVQATPGQSLHCMAYEDPKYRQPRPGSLCRLLGAEEGRGGEPWPAEPEAYFEKDKARMAELVNYAQRLISALHVHRGPCVNDELMNHPAEFRNLTATKDENHTAFPSQITCTMPLKDISSG
jgi:hypothetical protein